MVFHRIISLFIMASVLFITSENKIICEDQSKPGKICDFMAIYFSKDENGVIVKFRAIGLNKFNQVSMLINYQPTSDKNADSFFRIGPENTNGYMTQIIGSDENIDLTIRKITGGSAFSATESDGTVSTLDDLPKGLYYNPKNPVLGYILVGYSMDDDLLPVSEEKMKHWFDYKWVENCLMNKKVIFTAPP